ncbi:MAG: sigma-70 family RNA polymerase sigma factor [Bryobacterales bacterium]|nr:sigma-70 family RNA polymerase sigma factor [Bryobacterales bacterium]
MMFSSSSEKVSLDLQVQSEICVGVRDGVHADQERLYLLVKGLVAGYVRRASTWGHDPDDMLHDIYVAVCRAIRSGVLRDPERLVAYTLATAYRQGCSSLHQRVASRRQVAVDDTSPLRGGAPGVDEVMEDDEQRQELQRRLQRLPEIDRTIVMRFYFGEVPWQRIAADLNLTPTQFRLRKTRALARMREMEGAPVAARCS